MWIYVPISHLKQRGPRLLKGFKRLQLPQVRLKSLAYDLRPEKPRLVVTPRVSLMDAKTTFRVEGLEPLRHVTLKAEMFEDNGKLLYSNGHFVADKKGIVDTSFSESIGGSYDGVFPSGLLSLLKIAKGNYEFGRIYKRDMREPNKIKISLQEGHVPIDEQSSPLESIELERHFVGPGVQRIPVKTGRVRGVLYVPEGEGPFPGVIDMFGATGILNETRAALNASRGFVSLALAYFNYDDIPPEKILDLDLDYFEEATEFLLSHPMVKPGKCGVVANCIAGFIAYMMALHLDKVKATFLINMPVIPFSGELVYRGKVIATGPTVVENIMVTKEDGSCIPTIKYNEDLSQEDPVLINKMLNTSDVHFAVAIGEQDCYKFHWGWNKVEKILAQQNFQRCTLKVYPKAGHLIHAPYAPFSAIVYGRMWMKDYLKTEGILLNFGGEARESVAMQEDTWQWMKRFLDTHL